MAGFWDKVKKGAQEAGEKAAQLAKIAKIQAEITSLSTSRKSNFTSLGSKVYSLYKEGKLGEGVDTTIQELARKIDEIEKEILEKQEQIDEIKKGMSKETEEEKEEAKEAEEVKSKVSENATKETPKPKEEAPKESSKKENNE